MATFPLPTLAASISPTGITAPSYPDILESLKASFRLIYGEDAYLEPDSMDGQLLAIFAQALYDCNQATIAAYLSFSPATAVGIGLSNAVRINHMQRLVPTASQVNVTITGVTGTTLINCIVGDDDGQRWLLPSSVVIPDAGFIVVTASAEFLGALNAPVGSVTRILTPTAGWQSVSNANPATPGAPVESDAQLRSRQEITPALNAYTVLTGMAAAIKALPGVIYGKIYENDTDTTDANGLPEHSISVVVKGGVLADIAETIYRKKTPGAATYGNTTQSILDVSGSPRDINFSIPDEIAIKVQVTIDAGDDYTSSIGDSIKQAIVDYVGGLDIGEDVITTRLYVPALLRGAVESETYELTLLKIALAPSGTFATTDLPMTYIQKATATLSNVSIVIV